MGVKYLNVEEAILKKDGAIHTAREISGQPELWINIYYKVLGENQKLATFLDSIFKDVKKIILTGAGSSAYLGSSIEGVLQRKTSITTVTIPTTHLVSHPEDYLEAKVPTLLISFARSGNSPESVAAVKLADKYCAVCHHLVITCNSKGSLAKHKFDNKSYVFVLPEEANDQSLAMTGSYSGMLLTALLISDIHNIKSLKTTVETLKNYGTTLLTKYLVQIQKVTTLAFTRVVFLGSGPQYGTAMESHLKVQELTDGQVICKNDSYLGFRHGPKAVVDENTLLIYYFSNKMAVLRYEKDLVNSMSEGKKPIMQIGISEKKITDINIEKLLILTDKEGTISEEYLAVSNIILAQLLGFFKSLKLGLSPDNPSVSGAISRVVHGVIIY